MQRQPPEGAPEGTVWFGGSVDRFRITLRVIGEDVDPDRISELLACAPTKARRKGPAKTGHWHLEIDSQDCGEDDIEDALKALLGRLPSDSDLWASLISAYKVDLFCGLFLEASNRGFSISPEVSKMLADRRIEIGFDIYAPG